MAVWVSRYSNRELLCGKYYPVGISIGKPRWPLGYDLREQCFSLAPKGYMLKMDIEPFKLAYYGKLEGIGTDKIIGIVEKMRDRAESEGKELVLLCYEDIRKEDEWCHRTIFARWWLEQTGEIIEELPDPSEVKQKRLVKKQETNKAAAREPEERQMSFFD